MTNRHGRWRHLSDTRTWSPNNPSKRRWSCWSSTKSDLVLISSKVAAYSFAFWLFSFLARRNDNSKSLTASRLWNIAAGRFIYRWSTAKADLELSSVLRHSKEAIFSSNTLMRSTAYHEKRINSRPLPSPVICPKALQEIINPKHHWRYTETFSTSGVHNTNQCKKTINSPTSQYCLHL